LGGPAENTSWNVYKGGALKPIPSPVLVRRFSGEGGWHETCSGILGLTKMDWNNNTLYKKLPVTLVYSKAFADIIQQNPNIEAITSAHSPT
jgi:argonaute-like protein implicated in RNA metabolism and viral defense